MRAFASGIVVGALLALGIERVLRRHARGVKAPAHFIDGATPPSPAELATRIGEESHSATPQLMSEAADVEPDTQRW